MLSRYGREYWWYLVERLLATDHIGMFRKILLKQTTELPPINCDVVPTCRLYRHSH